MRCFCFALVFSGMLGMVPALGAEETGNSKQDSKPAPLRIIVADIEQWKASRADIEKVLYSSASEIWRFFPEHELPTMIVRPQGGPIVLFRRGSGGEILVRLNTQGPYWSQYAYQFTHEFCHIVCRYDDDPQRNKWFEESLCEAASIFFMRQMAETWKVRPPYPNWRSYGASLKSYADDVAAKNQLPEGTSFVEWFQENLPALYENATDRDRNRIVAIQLLPHFERSPESWEAVWYLNVAKLNKDHTFTDYFQAWRANAPQRHHQFIEQLAKEFQVELAD